MTDKYYYTYVLQSEVDLKLYTGYTKNLKQRFEQHNKGKVSSTKNRRPLKLIYFEARLCQADALKREKYSPCGINRRFNAKCCSTGQKTYYGKNVFA